MTEITENGCDVTLDQGTDESSYSLVFGSMPTGISNVNINENENVNENYYNLNGMRVNRNYKGVIITDGKKMLVK